MSYACHYLINIVSKFLRYDYINPIVTRTADVIYNLSLNTEHVVMSIHIPLTDTNCEPHPYFQVSIDPIILQFCATADIPAPAVVYGALHLPVFVFVVFRICIFGAVCPECNGTGVQWTYRYLVGVVVEFVRNEVDAVVVVSPAGQFELVRGVDEAGRSEGRTQ